MTNITLPVRAQSENGSVCSFIGRLRNPALNRGFRHALRDSHHLHIPVAIGLRTLGCARDNQPYIVPVCFWL